MSTIASPREPSLRRTPNSSARPSIDSYRSTITSPINTQNPTQPPPPPPPQQQQQSSSSSSTPQPGAKRSNRAALREYYNLRATAAARPPRIELPDSEVDPSDLDAPDFDADEYVNRVVAESSLEELLKLYTRVLGEVRALDAEKKALVYDNYSKLITATETIRKMRADMDPLNPMASTLDPAIAHIYTQASSIREALRESIPPPDSEEGRQREAERRRARTRELAVELTGTPARLRALVAEGKTDRAREQWEMPRRLLVAWRDKGVGGNEVQECIDEGDAALAGDGQGSVASARTSGDEGR